MLSARKRKRILQARPRPRGLSFLFRTGPLSCIPPLMFRDWLKYSFFATPLLAERPSLAIAREDLVDLPALLEEVEIPPVEVRAVVLDDVIRSNYIRMPAALRADLGVDAAERYAFPDFKHTLEPHEPSVQKFADEDVADRRALDILRALFRSSSGL